MFHTLVSTSRLILLSGSTTFIPWMLPITYSAIIGLLIQGVNPYLVLILSIAGAVGGTLALRISHTLYGEKLHALMPATYWKKEHLLDTKIGKKNWIRKKIELIQQALHLEQKKHTVFGLMFLVTVLPIPDLIGIHYCKDKIGFPSLLLSSALGKVATYAPLVCSIELGKIFRGI